LGTSNSFLCQYHGWTYDTDGKLIGAPLIDDVYKDDIDRDAWGLLAANVAIYKGLIFATFNKRAVPLEEFLGDFTWILDMMLGPRPGGVEVAGGFIRWTINMNWKFGAENSGGDTYHGTTTHRAAIEVGHRGALPSDAAATEEPAHRIGAVEGAGFTMVSRFGHGVNVSPVDEALMAIAREKYRPTGDIDRDTPLRAYLYETMDQSLDELGPYRSAAVGRFNANIFPNAGFHSSAQTIHLLHPRGPRRTEVWLLPLVDRDAPPEVKRWVRSQADHHFGPAGLFEEDDGENWEQATDSTTGAVASTLPFNYQLGIGRAEVLPEGLAPERIDGGCNEYAQLALLRRWHELMIEPS
jgi:phenylpropionate dioxygenase-like ring-hydroxylating dioxygenase large terminal subunit